MTKEIEAAIQAVVAATKAQLAAGTTSPDLRKLTELAIAAAEKAVGATGTQRRGGPQS